MCGGGVAATGRGMMGCGCEACVSPGKLGSAIAKSFFSDDLRHHHDPAWRLAEGVTTWNAATRMSCHVGLASLASLA